MILKLVALLILIIMLPYGELISMADYQDTVGGDIYHLFGYLLKRVISPDEFWEKEKLQPK